MRFQTIGYIGTLSFLKFIDVSFLANRVYGSRQNAMSIFTSENPSGNIPDRTMYARSLISAIFRWFHRKL